MTRFGEAKREMKAERLTFSTIIAALSYALDLTEGAHPGHAIRTCLLGMRIGEALGLSPAELSDLYYALLLKDAGCSSNASRLHQIVGGDEIRAKAFTKTNDWTRVEWRQFRFLFQFVHPDASLGDRVRAIGRMVLHSTENAEELFTLRCLQGASIVKALGLGEGVAEAIYSLDEHWDGSGYPSHLQGHAIPRLAQIVGLAQTVEVFNQEYGASAALDCIRRRSGRWFDPELVRVVGKLARRGDLWEGIGDAELRHRVGLLEPASRSLHADEATIDNICVAFAGVVDAKSPSTYTHSVHVARIATAMAGQMGLSPEELVMLRRAGLLHDVGKLSVPNSILDKPGKLDEAEWVYIRKHPFYTQQILERVPTFSRIAEIASVHHEKLDGSGYHRGFAGERLSLPMRILTMADMFEALSARRSYRPPLSGLEALEILRKDVPHALDASCLEALQAVVEGAEVQALPFDVPGTVMLARQGDSSLAVSGG